MGSSGYTHRTVAAYWFTTSTSALRLTTRLLPSSRSVLSFAVASVSKLPSQTSLLPQSSKLQARLVLIPRRSKCASSQRLSPKVSRPFSASRIKRPLTAGLPHPATFHLRRFSRPWRFTPLYPAPRLLHRGSLVGFLPSRVTPELKRATPSPKSLSLMVLTRQQLLRTVACAVLSRCTSRDLLRQFDRNHLLQVSLP